MLVSFGVVNRLLSSSAGKIQAMAKLQVNVDVTSDVVCPWYEQAKCS